MSDGPSDANRDGRRLDEIELAAARLADALDDVYDRAFGHPRTGLQIANEELARVGLKLVKR